MNQLVPSILDEHLSDIPCSNDQPRLETDLLNFVHQYK